MQTVTPTSSTSVMVQSPALRPAYFTNRAHALIDIIDTYEEENDLLSSNLREWGGHFLQEIMNVGLLSSVERLQGLVRLHFTRLEQDVLRDQLLSAMPDSPVAPLEEPVVERGWVWGRNVHRRCFVLFQGISPLDRKPMLENPPSHAFAQAVIDWKIVLTVALEGTPYTAPLSEGRLVTVRMPSIGDENVERAGFRRLAFSARIYQMRCVREHLVRQTERTLSLAAANQEENHALVIHAQEQADMHEARLEEMLHRLKRDHTAHIEQLNAQVEEQEKRYQISIKQLEENLAAAEASNQATAALLREQLAQLIQEQQRTRAAFEGQVQAAVQLQEQRVRELKARQAWIESQHQTQLTQMQSSHNQTVGMLQGRVDILSDKMTVTQSALRIAEQANEQHQQQIEAFHRQTEQLRRQVEIERRRAEEAEDDWSCSVM